MRSEKDYLWFKHWGKCIRFYIYCNFGALWLLADNKWQALHKLMFSADTLDSSNPTSRIFFLVIIKLKIWLHKKIVATTVYTEPLGFQLDWFWGKAKLFWGCNEIIQMNVKFEVYFLLQSRAKCESDTKYRNLMQ